MEVNRKPFQGILNIIRFNWHFYFLAGGFIITSIIVQYFFPNIFQIELFWLTIMAAFAISVSLISSFYIYDFSDLYQLNWLPDCNNKTVLNINAGFDETSELIIQKYPNSQLTICDFYDPEKHTEISIQRARKAYPPNPETISISTAKLPFPNDHFDVVLAILSAHEIRNNSERITFFKELNRVTKTAGRIMITEHLRDNKNFLAYSLGAFHFHSKSTWLKTFEKAKLSVNKEIKTTPFITTFVLKKHGNSF